MPERLKMAVLSVTILPIRLLLIFGLVLSTACFATLACAGVGAKKLKESPIPSWRRAVFNPIGGCYRCACTITHALPPPSAHAASIRVHSP